MKAKTSILKLDKFTVVKSSLETSFFPEELPQNMGAYMDEYSVDIDFDVMIPSNDTIEGREVYMIGVSINVNEEQKPGYNISVECASIFSFPKGVEKEDKDGLILSGVNISITSLRNYISQITTFSPFGQYMLPTIDMNDLIKQKQDSELTKEK